MSEEGVTPEDKGDVLDEDQVAAAKATEEAEAAKAAEEQKLADELKGKKDAEAKADDGGEDEPAKKKDNHMLPKRRYDAQVEARRNVERKNAELEEKLAKYEQENKNDDSVLTADSLNAKLSVIDKEIENARADGDVDKVIDLMTQQRTLNTEYFAAALNDAKTEATTTAKHETALEATIGNLEKAYEVLNPESEDFDQELVEEINELADAYELKGYPPADALSRAVALMMPEDNVVDIKSAKKTNVKKNVDAAGKHPVDTESVGGDSDSGGIQSDIDLAKLTEEEFDALPEETKARHRGDAV